ncbi:MAG: hypothetical protein KAS93_07010 [Gammaproteobacteria bacterium]|nr:hypothetical protein [Gammaproteobacteria bacterium]
MRKSILITLGTLLCCTLLNIANAQLPTNFKHIYFFGDSLSDMGNFQGVFPNEMTDQTAPVTNWANGKSKNALGKETWADFFAEKFSLRATPGSLSNPQGNDWAISGATTKDVYFQADNFLNSQKTFSDPNTTLYVVWAGPNDLLAITDPNSAAQVILNGMVNVLYTLDELYTRAHARNFLVIGMPDISVTPLFTNPKHVGSEVTMQTSMQFICNYWNLILLTNQTMTLQGHLFNPPLHAMMLMHHDAHIYTFNPSPLLDKIVQNPAGYGFLNKFDLSTQQAQNVCGANTCNNTQLEWYYAHFAKAYGDKYNVDPDQFVFYNAIHPTTHTHQIMADHVMQDSGLFQ